MRARRKYFIIGGVAILLVVLAGIGIISAFEGHGFWGREFCPGMRARCFHHGFSGEGFKNHILAHLDNRVEALDLSEAQKEVYGNVRLEIEAKLDEAMEKRREFLGELRELIRVDNPDMNALTELLKQRMGNMSEFASSMMDYFVEFYNTLDEDQKAKVMEKIRWRTGIEES